MVPARQAAVLLLLVAGCAAPGRSHRAAPDPHDAERAALRSRLAHRAASLLGRTGGFTAAGERFNRDCTGFVQAVYALEGIPLRALMKEAAPAERTGVAAAYRAVQRFGRVLGADEAPAPGDLVFWHQTYDRNRNGKADDRLTHVGIVESVAGGTVVFLHRGSSAVARGTMTTARPAARSANGVVLNSVLRTPDPRLRRVPVLAGALFAGYGRIDPSKIRAREIASRR